MAFLAGSSPLTRGKPILKGSEVQALRLIPAHAGKTCSGLPTRSHAWAHPRSRGENSTLGIALIYPPGSSPLTRGKRSWQRPGNASGGLIPAHAGKTASTCTARRQGRAHPRSRGENLLSGCLGRFRRGSSPLTRGKPPTCRACGQRVRLIPAHAGKTPHLSRMRTACAAHPRSRGENLRS